MKRSKPKYRYVRDPRNPNGLIRVTGDTPVVDAVNHPPHYTAHPSGVEAIDICEHFGFSIGNAIKYLWRAGLKGDAVEDLKKSVWYIQREIARREKSNAR